MDEHEPQYFFSFPAHCTYVVHLVAKKKTPTSKHFLTFLPWCSERVRSGSGLDVPVFGSTHTILQRLHGPAFCEATERIMACHHNLYIELFTTPDYTGNVLRPIESPVCLPKTQRESRHSLSLGCLGIQRANSLQH